MVGGGGVGCAIAAALAAEGLAALRLLDSDPAQSAALSQRLRSVYPDLDLVINATPLGMHAQNPLPFQVECLSPQTFAGDVVLEPVETPLVRSANLRDAAHRGGVSVKPGHVPRLSGNRRFFSAAVLAVFAHRCRASH